MKVNNEKDKTIYMFLNALTSDTFKCHAIVTQATREEIHAKRTVYV